MAEEEEAEHDEIRDDGLVGYHYVEELVVRHGLSCTAAVLDILYISAIFSALKRSDRFVVSTSTVLFTSYIIGRDFARTSFSDAAHPEVDYLREFYARISADPATIVRFDNEIEQFFLRSPNIKSFDDLRLTSNIALTSGVVKRLSGESRGRQVNLSELIGDLVRDPSPYLNSRLQRIDLPQEVLFDPFAGAPLGDRMAISRDRRGSLGLQAEENASAIATLFRVAEGEFSMAIFGAWGSGKSALARAVARRLTSGPRGEPKYDEVVFSAWQYRRQPELWIWLYESFVRAFLGSGAFHPVKAIRCGIAKHGTFQLIYAVALLALFSFPFTWITQLSGFGIATFGILGFVGMALIVRRWVFGVRNLINRYGLVATHKDKLGLQALVGDDLRAIVTAWTSPRVVSTRTSVFAISSLCIIASSWAALAATEPELPRWLGELLCRLHLSAECGSPGLAGVSWLMLILWSSLALSILILINWPWRSRRILLTIEDLDRCPPEEVVDLIDGIKLMLEDKSIGSRVQALVLADRQVIERAISNRFSIVVGEATDAKDDGRYDAGRRRVVREHLDKVFLCRFNIPPLAVKDVVDLSRMFAGEFNGGLNSTSIGPRSEAAVPISDSTTTGKVEGGAENANSIRPSSDMLTDDERVALSDREVAALLRSLETAILEDPTILSYATPRLILSIIFRYQLARLLLSGVSTASSPEKLTEKVGAGGGGAPRAWGYKRA